MQLFYTLADICPVQYTATMCREYVQLRTTFICDNFHYDPTTRANSGLANSQLCSFSKPKIAIFNSSIISI